MAQERRKYVVITNDDMVLKNIQLNNSVLSIKELPDYSGEEGRWERIGSRFGKPKWACTRCRSVSNREARYCNVCGSRNKVEWESNDETDI